MDEGWKKNKESIKNNKNLRKLWFGLGVVALLFTISTLFAPWALSPLTVVSGYFVFLCLFFYLYYRPESPFL
ncbi:hypothetical protein JW977_01280 [Candidatus Falkowbacteria bacterium]|nr:hypothetical protein [Candidatus Falkowbacteria bacterium]